MRRPSGVEPEHPHPLQAPPSPEEAHSRHRWGASPAMLPTEVAGAPALRARLEPTGRAAPRMVFPTTEGVR